MKKSNQQVNIKTYLIKDRKLLDSYTTTTGHLLEQDYAIVSFCAGMPLFVGLDVSSLLV